MLLVRDAHAYVGIGCCLAVGTGFAVIHVGMGDGSLTKMMASKGLCVMGVDADVAAGVKRGLRCVQYSGAALAAGSLSAAAEDAGGPVDAVLLYTAAHHAHEGLSSSDCLTDEALQEYRGLLKPNGRLCVEVPVSSDGSQTADAAVIGAALEAAGYKVMALELLMMAQQRLRLVAQKC
jgi:SAM-dependent methyltransferase